MKRNKEELLEIVKKYIGDRNDEDTLSLIEDISDSYTDPPPEDWGAKYKALDEEWRRRYRDRFFDKNETDITISEQTEGVTEIKENFEDLLKEDD